VTPAGQTLGTWGDVNTHNYSKDPAWSADERLLVLKRVKSLGTTLYLDGQTYRPLFARSAPAGTAETRWHPTIPDEMVIVGTDATVRRWNARTNAVTATLFAAPGYAAADWSYEGDLSTDARYVAIRATRSADGKRVGFRADLVTGAKGPDIDFAAEGIFNPDAVSVSAKGTYIMATGGITGGTPCCGGAYDAHKVFDAATGRLVQFWSEYGRPSHYDHAVDAFGNEVAVGVDKSPANPGRVVMRRLADGAVTVLTKGGFAGHTSARNAARPGWAYVSHSYNGPNWPPYRDEVFAVRLDGSQAIERYGNLHGLNSGDYDAEAHAVPAPDGRRVLFASEWGSAGARPVHAYGADARPLGR
jgi:hypothetical protein